MIVFVVNPVLQDAAVVVVVLVLVVVETDALAIVEANAMEHAVGLVDMAVPEAVPEVIYSPFINERE